MPRLIPILLIILMLLILPTTAQDESQLCNADHFNEDIIPALQEWFDAIQQAIDDGDTDLALEHLRVLENRAAMMRSLCSAWVFDSETEGLQPVIGPVTFLNGTYRARATTEGYIAVKIVTIDGDCGGDTHIFNEFEGKAADGAEVVFQTAENCVALIEMDNITAPWTLEFELIKLDE